MSVTAHDAFFGDGTGVCFSGLSDHKSLPLIAAFATESAIALFRGSGAPSAIHSRTRPISNSESCFFGGIFKSLSA